MQAPVDIIDLSKTYRGKKGRKISALRNLSLKIEQGEIFGFLGPNGAGKSTTIKTLAGLIRPTRGEARIYGISIGTPAARKKIGYLPENPAFYDFLTAREFLRFVGSQFELAPREIADRSARVLALLDLEAAANRPVRSYSKGMVQRLGLAQALLHDPDLYILDEPMSGLDPLGRALVKDIILDLKKQGKTVFFSTHITADIERVCDRVGVIVAGVLREERVVGELLREGVDGYDCRVRGVQPDLTGVKDVSVCTENVWQVFVPRERFDVFSAEILHKGGSFDLIEPRRRDVEDYFLKLVRTSGSD